MNDEPRHHASRIPMISRKYLITGCIAVALVVPVVGRWAWEWRERVRLVSNVRVAMSTGDFEEAKSSLRIASSRFDAGHGQLVFLQAVLARREGRLADAEVLLRQAADLGWSTSRIELQRCLTIAQSGRINQVQARLNEIMLQGTTDDVAQQIYEASAKGYLASYQLRDAWSCLNSWLEWQPNNVNARRWRGQISEIMARPRDAVDEYLEVLNIAPDDEETHRRIAQSLLMLNRVDEACSHYEWLTARRHDDAEAILGLARCKRRMGALGESRELAESVIKLDVTPEILAEAQYEIGTTLLALRDPEHAVELLELAEDGLPSNQELHYALSRAYAQLGHEDAATRSKNRAQQVDSIRVRTREILQILAGEPNNTELRVELAEILASQGERNKSQQWFEIASGFDSSRVSTPQDIRGSRK
jgi:tetratricopeptide (TPR) repeat protein